jgi:hypothetical protein
MASTTAPYLHDAALVGEVPVEHLADFSIDLHPAQPIATKTGLRMTFILRAGTVEGPRLRGEFIPGGGDWLLVGEDRIGRVDVRATIRTHDGALIHYTARGVIKIPDDGLERLSAGARIPMAESYVRTTPQFETGDPRYDWLNEAVAIGYNELSADHIDYRIYRVL